MREPNEREREREAEREALRARAALSLLQVAGIGFVAVVAIGLAPRVLSSWWPGLGPSASVVALAVGVLVALATVGVGVARLRRIWREQDRRDG